MIRSVILKECEDGDDFSEQVDNHIIELQKLGNEIRDIKYHSNTDEDASALFSSVLIIYKEIK